MGATSLLLRPPPLAQRHLAPLALAGARALGAPGPVLAQAHLGVVGVVKVDGRDGGLDEGPDAPVEAREPAEQVDLSDEFVDFGGLVHGGGRGVRELGKVGADVLGDKLAALGAGGEHAVVAVEATPLGEVVGEVKGGGGGRGVFVVDEGDGLGGLFGGGGEGGLGHDDDIAAEEVAVGEDELGGWG